MQYYDSITRKKVLITGGASGIGRVMRKLVLQKDAELVIWDINTQAVEDTLTESACHSVCILYGLVRVYYPSICSTGWQEMFCKFIKQWITLPDVNNY